MVMDGSRDDGQVDKVDNQLSTSEPAITANNFRADLSSASSSSGQDIKVSAASGQSAATESEAVLRVAQSNSRLVDNSTHNPFGDFFNDLFGPSREEVEAQERARARAAQQAKAREQYRQAQNKSAEEVLGSLVIIDQAKNGVEANSMKVVRDKDGKMSEIQAFKEGSDAPVASYKFERGANGKIKDIKVQRDLAKGSDGSTSATYKVVRDKPDSLLISEFQMKKDSGTTPEASIAVKRDSKSELKVLSFNYDNKPGDKDSKPEEFSLTHKKVGAKTQDILSKDDLRFEFIRKDGNLAEIKALKPLTEADKAKEELDTLFKNGDVSKLAKKLEELKDKLSSDDMTKLLKKAKDEYKTSSAIKLDLYEYGKDDPAGKAGELKLVKISGSKAGDFVYVSLQKKS